MAKFIENQNELKRSVCNFMKPNDTDIWKDACGVGCKYFVYFNDRGKSKFGLSKFCAFKDITVRGYVNGLRRTTDGEKTRKHISRKTGKSWIPLSKVPNKIKQDFNNWFRSFYKNWEKKELFIMMLE